MLVIQLNAATKDFSGFQNNYIPASQKKRKKRDFMIHKMAVSFNKLYVVPGFYIHPYAPPLKLRIN